MANDDMAFGDDDIPFAILGDVVCCQIDGFFGGRFGKAFFIRLGGAQ